MVLGYYYGKFRGRAEEFKAHRSLTSGQSAKDRAVKFQQYLDTLQIARDSGSQAASNSKPTESS